MKYDIKQVAASLAKGHIIYGFGKFILVFCSVFPFSIFIIDIGILITDMNFESNMILGLSIANIFCVLFGLFSVYLLVKNWRLKNKISLWLEDAVAVEDANLRRAYQSHGNPYRIEVTFDYLGKHYRFFSKESTKVEGYHKFYIRYCKRVGGKATLLYSPSFDQVLLLKDIFAR